MYNKILLKLIVLFIAFATFYACDMVRKNTPDISQWRGDNRDGIYQETGLLEEWPQSGPDLLWVYEGIGKGYASPSVLNGQIFINGEQDSSSYIFAFDLDGNLLWQSPNGKEFMGDGFSANYPGSRSTPTVVDDLVYTTSGKGRIACFEVISGEEKWSVNIVKDLGGQDSFFGYSESPLVYKDKLICFPGGIKNNTVALNRHTGEIVWSNNALKDTFSYCSPILVEFANKKILAGHSRHHLYTQDIENGHIMGSSLIDHYQYDGEHCNSPLYSDGKIFFIGNEKKDGASCFELTGSGQLNEVWKNPKIKNNFNAYVKVDSCLFTMVKGNKLYAIDTKDGSILSETKAATGSIIYADNKFYCYGMNGDVNLITYADKKFLHHGSFKVEKGSGHHFAHPVISNGVLYIRHGNALMAYKI